MGCTVGRHLTLAGDGRLDSPGYPARFGTYTFMDVASDLIVDYHLAKSTDTTSFVTMEKMGFIISLDRCLEQRRCVLTGYLFLFLLESHTTCNIIVVLPI